MNPLQDAFISYGRADSKQFAKTLNDRLVELGKTIWFDFEDIPFGVDYQKQIDDGIEKADNFLFLISPHSINSPYCGLEIELALQRGKRIIPLLHVEEISRETWQQRNPGGDDEQWVAYQEEGRHTSFANMPPVIAKINWIYMREGLDDFEQAFQQLLELVERQQDYVHRHTVLLNGALEWERNQKQTRYLLIGQERQDAEAWLGTRFEAEQAPCGPTDLHCEFITESIKNANNLMTDVFLCHAEKDREMAEQVRRSLMRNGITTWTHRGDIEFGTDFHAAMDRGMEEADTVVFLLSPHSLASSYCRQELDQALALHKRIVPMRAGTVEAEQVPEILRSLQYIDLTDNQTDVDYLQDESDLLRILKQDGAFYKEHKVLLAKALKWERQQRNPCILLRGYELQHAQAWLKLATNYPDHGPTDIQRKFITESERQPSGLNLDVFVSYSRADSDFARKLNDGLQRQGKRTWFDQESIASGTDFQQEIYRGIEASDHFLFILSPQSVQSPYCADEVEYAAKLHKRIVTVRHRGVEAGELHPELAKVQWVDFLGNRGDFAANFQELIRTLDTDPKHLRFHTRLLMQGIEWEEKGKRDSLLLRGDELKEAEQWLLMAAGKQPSPTALQGEYVAESRRMLEVTQKSVAKRQRIWMTGLASLALIALIGAGGTAWQYMEAETQRMEAETQKREAETQRMEAESQRMEAEKERDSAVNAKKEAEDARDKASMAQLEAEKQKNAAVQSKQEADRLRVVSEQAHYETERALAKAEAAQAAEAILAVEAEQKRQEAEIAQQVAEKNAAATNNAYIDILRELYLNIENVLNPAAVPGEIIAHHDAWTTLSEKQGKSFAMLRVYGEGKVIATGHGGVFDENNGGNASSLFLKSAFGWLDFLENSSSNIAFSSGHCEIFSFQGSRFVGPISSLKLQIEEWKYGVSNITFPITAEKLAAIDILVIGNAWGDFERSEIDAIEDFVKNGGGLFVVGLGWSWQQYSTSNEDICLLDQQVDQSVNNMSTYPMNRLVEPYHMSWTNKY